MGAEHSRIVAHPPVSFQTLQCGIHYARSDVAVWPHLSPLAQWFTAQDALALRAKLRQRAATSMLDFDEFVAWLQNGRAPLALHQPLMPVRHDILTPPPLQSLTALASTKTRNNKNPEDPETTSMLEMYLEHVFHSLKAARATKVYAMEVLAALVLVSRAIWSLDDKVRALIELFHDPSLSARHAARCGAPHCSVHSSSSSSRARIQCFKETDVAQLILCVMRGVAKMTIGVGAVWDAHGLSITTFARACAASCMRDAMAARKQHQQQCPCCQSQQTPETGAVSPSKRSKAATSSTRRRTDCCARHEHDCVDSAVGGGISEHEFRRFVASKPAVRRFLALFAAEELRNPFTFSPLSSPSTGAALSPRYRAVLAKQTELYHSLLQHYVTFEGRDVARRLSAAMLIQSTWRRRRSRSLLEHHREERVRERQASVTTLQRYMRQLQLAKELERRADAEREAFNGGVFVAGSGPCVPRKVATEDSSATRNHPGLVAASASPLTLIETFKLLNVCIRSVAASQTCAVALADDRRTLFAWGTCLPCAYASGNARESDESGDVQLFQPTPARLAHTFAPGAGAAVTQLACGLRHALALTADGLVYSWGFNDHGQLGHGSSETLEARTGGQVTYATYFSERDGRTSEYLATPTPLVYFQGSAAQRADPIPVQQVCCGDYYCMALSRDGDVFTWGEASEGQLGHGDAHAAFQVAFVDVHMLNSAYTFLAQPEPVLALSTDAIAHIACCKNHSVALARDGRVFEWGSWGKRRGCDTEHAFVPVAIEDAQELRLRQLSVGDHHIVAEGSSVWMSLVGMPVSQADTGSDGRDPSTGAVEPETSDDDDSSHTVLAAPKPAADAFGVTKRGFYLACAAYSCSFAAIEQFFVGKNGAGDVSAASCERVWTCTLVDLDIDDLEDVNDDDAVASDARALDSVPDAHRDEATSVRSLWRKRAQQYALSVEQIGRFDARAHQLQPLSYRQNYGYSYEKLLATWLLDHVDDRLVVFPRGKPAGLYVQFLVPYEAILSDDVEQRVESEQADGYVAPAMVEFHVCGSNTAQSVATKRGFAVHAFHPGMDDAKLTTLQRKKKKKTSVVTEENSLFILEFDASCLADNAPALDDDSGGDDAVTVLGERIVGEMTARVLVAQEAGVLAVLIVLDLFNVEPFELKFDDDSGVYIPVFMANKYALATYDHSYDPSCSNSSTGAVLTKIALHELLERMLATPLSDTSDASGAHGHRATLSRFVSRPMWTARCFRRVDTLSARVRCALANGAAGVIVTQDAESTEMDGETRGAPAFHRALSTESWQVGDEAQELHQQTRLDDRLVAMISYADGERLRASSHLSRCQKYMPLLSRDGASYELLAQVSLEIRPGGTTYAWGNAENGRLGVGPSWSSVFHDGYEALTDTAYRFVDRPTPVVSLAGLEMQQLACGSAHSLALTAEGKVFAWGRGSRGALAQTGKRALSKRKERGATESNRDAWTPAQVHALRFEHIAQVAANDACSLFVNETVSPALYRERRREVAQLKAVVRKSVVGSSKTQQ